MVKSILHAIPKKKHELVLLLFWGRNGDSKKEHPFVEIVLEKAIKILPRAQPCAAEPSQRRHHVARGATGLDAAHVQVRPVTQLEARLGAGSAC